MKLDDTTRAEDLELSRGGLVVTRDVLVDLNICEEYLEVFDRLFPSGRAVIDEDTCVTHATRFDWGWAQNRLLTKAFRERYVNIMSHVFVNVTDRFVDVLADIQRNHDDIVRYVRRLHRGDTEVKTQIIANHLVEDKDVRRCIGWLEEDLDLIYSRLEAYFFAYLMRQQADQLRTRIDRTETRDAEVKHLDTVK